MISFLLTILILIFPIFLFSEIAKRIESKKTRWQLSWIMAFLALGLEVVSYFTIKNVLSIELPLIKKYRIIAAIPPFIVIYRFYPPELFSKDGDSKVWEKYSIFSRSRSLRILHKVLLALLILFFIGIMLASYLKIGSKTPISAPTEIGLGITALAVMFLLHI